MRKIKRNKMKSNKRMHILLIETYKRNQISFIEIYIKFDPFGRLCIDLLLPLYKLNAHSTHEFKLKINYVSIQLQIEFFE